MELFSEKFGYKLKKTVIQIDSMDNELRIGLWNALDIYYLTTEGSGWIRDHSQLFRLFYTLSLDYFKKPLDTLPEKMSECKKGIRDYFFNCAFYEVYDLIQFIANSYEDEAKNNIFIKYCNTILEREVSGYRFINGIIAPITSKEEIEEIEEVLGSKNSLQPASIHLETALKLLSDRESPDYRNSIKESISAVEAICRLIAGSSATLSKALTEIRKQGKVDVHSALGDAFNKLYGFTSDEGGIRHSLLEEPNLNFEDAKFMLVSCSAFINYLKVKTSESGIELGMK